MAEECDESEVLAWAEDKIRVQLAMLEVQVSMLGATSGSRTGQRWRQRCCWLHDVAQNSDYCSQAGTQVIIHERRCDLFVRVC